MVRFAEIELILKKLPYKEVDWKDSRTVDEKRQVKTAGEKVYEDRLHFRGSLRDSVKREEHKQTPEYIESTVETEEEWNSKSVETIKEGPAEMGESPILHSKWPKMEKSVQEVLISVVGGTTGEGFAEQIESERERSKVKVNSTFTSERKQDVIVKEDDEKVQQTFLDQPNLGELRFEKVLGGLSEHWSGNIEKTSINIAKEAESLQRLQDFYQLVHVKIKDTKGNEESKVSAVGISLNNGKRWYEDVGKLSPSPPHNEIEMKNITAIYEWTQREDMEDEKREWREVGKIRDTVVDIKHVNEISSELDLDVEDVDIALEGSDKSRWEQVIKCDRAIQNVAGEQHEMDGNYPQDTEVKTTEERVISWELTNNVEEKDGTYFHPNLPTENQIWPEEGKGSVSNADKSNMDNVKETAIRSALIGRKNGVVPKKRLKKELNDDHSGNKRDTAQFLQVQSEECVERKICDVEQQQISSEVALRDKKGDRKKRKSTTEVEKRLTGEDVEDIVIRLKDAETSSRAKDILEASDEDTMRMRTEQILNENVYILGEKPVSKYLQEYNILGQKGSETKESTTFQYEVLVEQEKSVSRLLPEVTKERQERNAGGTPVVVISSEREREEKLMEPENNRHETAINEKIHTKHLGSQNLKEAGLKPCEKAVLESNVSMESEQEAKTMQCKRSGIHSDLITSGIARQENLKQSGSCIHENGETFQNGFFRRGEQVGTVLASVIVTPAALTAVGTPAAYECMMKEHQQRIANSEQKIFNIKKPATTHKTESTESEILASNLEVEMKEAKPIQDVMPDREVLQEYGALIFKEPATEREHIERKAWTESEEVVNRLSLAEIETKPFEDFTPDKESAIISKELTTELVH
ncbi:hypothetical protein LOAG_14359, partial [Loa loa]